ncbi:hypothetical protein BDV18DRAFT_140744 [Aspergillus unguis]
MPLTIHLASPKKHYTGNETVVGKVIFSSPTPTPLQDIRVSFTGRSKAKISKVKGAGAISAPYKSKCILFEKEKILRSAKANGERLPAGEYAWGFEFVVPSRVQASSGKWPEKSPFRSDSSHSLPPTLGVEKADGERRVNCAIEYWIEARVMKPSGGIFSNRTPLAAERIQLSFLPEIALSSRHSEHEKRMYRDEKQQLFSIRSALLLPQNKGRGLKMAEKIQGLFAPGQLPRFSFTVALSYPTRVIQGVPMEMYCDIAPHLEDPSVPSVPEILMQSISITAIGQTAARAAPSFKGAISAGVDEEFEVLPKTSLRLPVSGRMDLGTVFGPLVLRNTDVSFQTFNIARTYRLCVVIVVECAGKVKKFKVMDLPFDVVADVERPDKGIDMKTEAEPPVKTQLQVLNELPAEREPPVLTELPAERELPVKAELPVETKLPVELEGTPLVYTPTS